MTPEVAEARGDLPRRRALRGLVGSLAGIAALGAVGASAKKKNRKKNQRSKKGRLVRYETASQSADILPAVPTTITATCPAAGKKEQVFATGGGYTSNTEVLDTFTVESQITSDGTGWTARFLSSVPGRVGTVTVVCAYYKTR